MKQFEYANYYIDMRDMKYKSLDGKESGKLNDLGKEGWQLAGVRENSYDSFYPHIGIFIREMNEISISWNKDVHIDLGELTPFPDLDIRTEPDDFIPDTHPGTW